MFPRFFKNFHIGRFVQELRKGEVDSFMQRFKAFFADFPYELNDLCHNSTQNIDTYSPTFQSLTVPVSEEKTTPALNSFRSSAK